MKQKKRVTLVWWFLWNATFVTETVENNKLLKRFKNFYITATEQDIDEFIAIDNENTHVFQK